MSIQLSASPSTVDQSKMSVQLLLCAAGYQKGIQAFCPQIALSVGEHVSTQRYSQEAAGAQRREKILPNASRENPRQVALELGPEG